MRYCIFGAHVSWASISTLARHPSDSSLAWISDLRIPQAEADVEEVEDDAAEEAEAEEDVAEAAEEDAEEARAKGGTKRWAWRGVVARSEMGGMGLSPFERALNRSTFLLVLIHFRCFQNDHSFVKRAVNQHFQVCSTANARTHETHDSLQHVYHLGEPLQLFFRACVFFC